ncbi:endonuclease III [Desulfarculus baarsii DSM 2075]|uniref:Endonuclease III n=1 Tax=Desulfarculus baarsii (strain ATCC 33931 / DSM 2075 / LMG 7858 / VKM B-1802 / 2st14) TaxID=644282 RepID=E1QL40_DESB2|nr:endonuclease III [Desulfarculus baarsii]ADK85305.1 endonuclease III [Desulfarculus baarsii DSM 2075]
MAARGADKAWSRPQPQRVAAILAELDKLYPAAQCALRFADAWQLLVATILSAQCTDERVNMVTPEFFARWPGPAQAAAADQAQVEEVIRSTGFFRNKAKAIIGAARAVLERHGGQVPAAMDDLTGLPGVGRKTANVVLGNAFGVPGITVDTHVKRLAGLLGLSDQADPDKIEQQLMEIIPEERWTLFSHQMILHGRQVCPARKPRCGQCALAPHCPHGQSVLAGPEGQRRKP